MNKKQFIESRLPTRNKKALFSHKSDLWKTPKDIYEWYKAIGFFDPCPENPTFNGLEIEWGERAFVNPPYSQIKKWVDKAIIENEKGCFVKLLVPARTDTQWFKKLYRHGALFVFAEGRLHFDDAGPAPFPSVMIVLHKTYRKNPQMVVAKSLISLF